MRTGRPPDDDTSPRATTEESRPIDDDPGKSTWAYALLMVVVWPALGAPFVAHFWMGGRAIDAMGALACGAAWVHALVGLRWKIVSVRTKRRSTSGLVS